MTRQGLFHITLKSKEHVGILETLIDDHELLKRDRKCNPPRSSSLSN